MAVRALPWEKSLARRIRLLSKRIQSGDYSWGRALDSIESFVWALERARCRCGRVSKLTLCARGWRCPKHAP